MPSDDQQRQPQQQQQVADIAELRVAEGPEVPVLWAQGRELIGGPRETETATLLVRENELAEVSCLVRGASSLPADHLDWLLDSTQNISHLSKISHELDPSTGTYTTRSLLRLNTTKVMNTKSLSCLASHQLWLTPMTASLTLNVLYEPSFTISREPGFGVTLLEGMEVTLSCQIDSNPVSAPIWVRDADNKASKDSREKLMEDSPTLRRQRDGTLEFRPVRKWDEGWYRCKTENKEGNFSSFGYLMRVQSGGNSELEEVGKRSSSNQQQRLMQPNQPIVASNQANSIEALKDAPRLADCGKVQAAKGPNGAPEIEQPSSRSLQVQLGQRLTLSLRFCCQPQPLRLFWVHRHLAMAPGRMLGPYTTRDLYASHNSLYCYESSFEIEQVKPEDIGTIYMFVGNERGHAGANFLLKLSNGNYSQLAFITPPTSSSTRFAFWKLKIFLVLANVLAQWRLHHQLIS